LAFCLLDPPFVDIVTDFFALETDEINSVDTLIDFLTVENPAAELLDPDA
jgi:hypothetical protein